MEDKYKDYVCYIPVHANYSQVESISPFIERIRTKVFVYPWNTDGEKMADYFSQLKVSKPVDVQVMNELNILKEVWAEPDGTKIIVLLTSSKTYSFGLAQWKFFRAVQEVFPYKVKDVFTVGHCMYGCDSCSVSEHRFPLFFSRYIRNTLPFNGGYVQKKYIGEAKDPQLKTVLICPSVQEKSFLNNAEIIHQLIELKSRAPFNDPKKYRFLLKLHAHCFFSEKNGRVHPLHDVTKEEHQHAQVLQSVFELVPEEEFNILPFLEQFDIILTDLDSSVPFETLYFSNKSVLAFQKVNAMQYHDEYNVEKDEKYLQLLNLFCNSEELASYMNGTTPMKKTDESARQFFTSIYGTPDGAEVDKVAKSRDWFGAMPPQPEMEQDLIAATHDVTVLLDKLFVNPLPTDYLARGLDIPAEAVAFTVFVANHKSQLDFYGIPQQLWRPLFNKLRNEIFDSGAAFQFAMGEDDTDSAHPKLFLVSTRSMQPQEDIFLIDHAWTTSPKQAKEQLAAHPQLLQRMEDILDLVPEESEDQKTRIEKVVETMWYSSKSYRVTDPNGGELLVWYVMDELGSRINHSDEPNMRCTNFLYLDNQMAYSLIWPETAIEEGELITRDYVRGTKTDLEREAKLYVLSEHFSQRGVDIDTDAVKTNLINAFQEHKATLKAKADEAKKSLVMNREPAMISLSKKPELGRKLKVFADTDLVNNFLKYEKFEIVHDPSEADILWYQTKDIGSFDHLKNALGKQSDAPLMVNQYPNENAITYKHLLVETLEDYFGDLCHEWLSPSYDLDKLLPQFVGHFVDREEKESHNNNVWIVKPWNLARGIEITVSKNLMEIIRLAESGPKLASIYINPTLYNKRKFDLRYIVMVRSLEPLEVYLFKMFWIRLANVEYSLDEFDNYEKHFTVMNYSKFQMTQLLYTDFIKSFEEQYPSTPWATVQTKINKAIYNSVLAAVPKIKRSQSKFDVGQCSGMYGVDVMVDSEMNAKVLEINFGPDCTRACNYDPHFYNVLFAVMFTNDWFQNPEITQRVVPI